MTIALILFGRTASGDADWLGSNIPVTAHLSRSLGPCYAQYSNIMKFYRDSGRRTLRLRQRLLKLERIVDEDDIGTSPGQHPPTEVAIRQPCGVVSNSGTTGCLAERRVRNSRWYRSLARMRRQSRDNLSARSWPPGYARDRPSRLNRG